MKSIVKTNCSTYKLLSVFIFTLCLTSVNAQDTEILEIRNGGATINSAVVHVTLPNNKSQNIPVSIGDFFPSGATIKTSGNTTLKLNANGNEQEILPNTTHSIVRITPKEHAHKTTQGKSVHYVNNKSVVYKASGRKIYAKAPGTVFSVAVDGKAESFNTLEGQIATVEEVKLKVKQGSENNASKRDRPLTSGKTTYINAGETKYFDGNEIVEKFDSYEQALAVIQQQLDNNRNAGYIDFEQIANEYLLVGELYLDEGNANNALTYITTAIEYFYNLEYRELSIAEGYLLLAEVYYMTEMMEKVGEYANKAIDLIKPVLQLDTLEYQYAREDGDLDLMDDIAYDLFDEYDYLGWAYELLDDEDNSSYYYGEADKLGIGY